MKESKKIEEVLVENGFGLVPVHGTSMRPLLKEGKSISDGKTSDVMTSQNLKDIYGMDIAAYMKEQLSRWDAIS